MIRKILAAFVYPWFLEGPRFTLDDVNRMKQDQIKRRLASIRDLKASLREDIGKARRQKKARKTLYAEMEALTSEQLRLEAIL